MRTEYRCLFIVFVATLLALTGCKKKNAATGSNSQGATVSADDIIAVRDTLARDMSKMALDDLKTTYIGKKCVVMARAPDGGLKLGTTPPPPGMVRLLGQTVIYNGEFDQVSAGSVTVRAAYPTAGNYKRVEIDRGDIQSFHLAR